MRVQFISGVLSIVGRFNAGDVAELPDDYARSLIVDGYAKDLRAVGPADKKEEVNDEKNPVGGKSRRGKKATSS